MKSRLKRYVFLSMIVLVVIAGLGAYSYYQPEITTYFKMGGWNRGKVSQLVVDFIRLGQRGKVAEAMKLMDGEDLKPIESEGKIVAIELVAPGGRETRHVPIRDLFQPGEVKVDSVELRTEEGGNFWVQTSFGGDKHGRFVVKRIGGAYKIVRIPLVTTPNMTPRSPIRPG